MDIVFGFFVFVAVFFVAAAILTVLAKRQIDFHLLGASVDDAFEVLDSSGALRGGWKTSGGDGAINIRPGFFLGGRDGRPVVSINLESDHAGTHVQVWMSAWVSRFGMIEPFQSIIVMLRRNKIVKALNAVCEPSIT
jgi:hypothetical protein